MSVWKHLFGQQRGEARQETQEESDEAERKFRLAMDASEQAISAQNDAESSLTHAAEKQREAREHLGRFNSLLIGAIKATAQQAQR